MAGAGRSRWPAHQRSSLAPAPAEHRHDAPLDRGGALVLDQLLADGPHERLEGHRAAAHAQPGAPSQRAPDQRIAREAPVEVAQIVVDAEREAQPLDPVLGSGPAGGARAEQDGVRGRLGHAHGHRLTAGVVQQPLKDIPAPAR